MAGSEHTESHGNVRGMWPSSGHGAAELSLRQEHCCEPCVSWAQSLLPAAQQALLRSGVGGKTPFGLLEHLKEQPVSPRMSPYSHRHLWCGAGRKRAKVMPWDAGPAPFALTSSDPEQP